MKYVEVLRGFPPYARGDRCAFPPARADALIRTGFAVEVAPPVVEVAPPPIEAKDDLTVFALASADGAGEAPSAGRDTARRKG